MLYIHSQTQGATKRVGSFLYISKALHVVGTSFIHFLSSLQTRGSKTFLKNELPTSCYQMLLKLLKSPKQLLISHIYLV